MADYISREAAIESLVDYYNSLQDFVGFGTIKKNTIGECIMRVKEDIPSADVRPVVLCRDCRWWTKQEKSLQGRCELAGFYPTGEWFCANGERAECGADMRGDHGNGNKT
jgi:hypothetical protein